MNIVWITKSLLPIGWRYKCERRPQIQACFMCSFIHAGMFSLMLLLILIGIDVKSFIFLWNVLKTLIWLYEKRENCKMCFSSREVWPRRGWCYKCERRPQIQACFDLCVLLRRAYTVRFLLSYTIHFPSGGIVDARMVVHGSHCERRI